MVESSCSQSSKTLMVFYATPKEGFNDWGGRGYDDFVPVRVAKTAPSGERTT